MSHKKCDLHCLQAATTFCRIHPYCCLNEVSYFLWAFLHKRHAMYLFFKHFVRQPAPWGQRFSSSPLNGVNWGSLPFTRGSPSERDRPTCVTNAPSPGRSLHKGDFLTAWDRSHWQSRPGKWPSMTSSRGPGEGPGHASPGGVELPGSTLSLSFSTSTSAPWTLLWFLF